MKSSLVVCGLVVVLSACDTLGEIKEEGVIATAEYNDNVTDLSLKAPCNARLGSIHRNLSQDMIDFLNQYADSFCKDEEE